MVTLENGICGIKYFCSCITSNFSSYFKHDGFRNDCSDGKNSNYGSYDDRNEKDMKNSIVGNLCRVKGRYLFLEHGDTRIWLKNVSRCSTVSGGERVLVTRFVIDEKSFSSVLDA